MPPFALRKDFSTDGRVLKRFSVVGFDFKTLARLGAGFGVVASMVDLVHDFQFVIPSRSNGSCWRAS